MKSVKKYSQTKYTLILPPKIYILKLSMVLLLLTSLKIPWNQFLGLILKEMKRLES